MALGTFLKDRAPQRLRGLQFLSFNDLATIEARIAVSDAGGGATYTWTAGSVVPCRVYPYGGHPGVIGGRIDERTTHFCMTPMGTVARPGERFVVTNRGTFEVTRAPRRSDSAAPVFELVELT